MLNSLLTLADNDISKVVYRSVHWQWHHNMYERLDKSWQAIRPMTANSPADSMPVQLERTCCIAFHSNLSSFQQNDHFNHWYLLNYNRISQDNKWVYLLQVVWTFYPHSVVLLSVFTALLRHFCVRELPLSHLYRHVVYRLTEPSSCVNLHLPYIAGT